MFMGQRVPAIYHGQPFENYYLAGSQKATGYIQEINMVIVQMENVLVRTTFLIQKYNLTDIYAARYKEFQIFG